MFLCLACNTFTDCALCLANRGKRYNCSWCDDIQKCSDGFDRSRQQWIRAQCHRSSSQETCPNSLEDPFENQQRSHSSSMSTIVQFEEKKTHSINSSRQNSAFQTFRTILLTLLFSVLILSLATLAATYLYAYRNPTSPAGMWLLEHRPSTYLARFKRFTGSN